MCIRDRDKAAPLTARLGRNAAEIRLLRRSEIELSQPRHGQRRAEKPRVAAHIVPEVVSVAVVWLARYIPEVRPKA